MAFVYSCEHKWSRPCRNVISTSRGMQTIFSSTFYIKSEKKLKICTFHTRYTSTQHHHCVLHICLLCCLVPLFFITPTFSLQMLECFILMVSICFSIGVLSSHLLFSACCFSVKLLIVLYYFVRSTVNYGFLQTILQPPLAHDFRRAAKHRSLIIATDVLPY